MLCGTAETVMAETKKNREYDMIHYYEDMYSNYRNFMKNTWQEVMRDSDDLSYGQLINSFEGKWQERIDFALGILEENLTMEKYLEILINLTTMMRYEFEDSLKHQAEADSLKTIADYGKDVAGILLEAVGVDAKLDTYLQKNIIEQIKKVNNGLKIVFDGLEIKITSAKQYELYKKTLKEYEMYQSFLGAISKYAQDSALKDAAKLLLKNLSSYIRYGLECITENSEKTAKFLNDDIWLGEIVPRLLKDKETLNLSQRDYDCLNMIYESYTQLTSYKKITFDLGIFAGDMLFGTTNVFIRYNEMYAMKNIRDALNKRISQLDKSIKQGEQSEEISQVCQLLRSLVYVDSRGSYCLYEMLENDSQLLSLCNFKNYETYEEWYKTVKSIFKIQLNAIDTLIPDVENYCLDAEIEGSKEEPKEAPSYQFTDIISSFPLNFTFTSGVGGWQTNMSIEEDGTFTGKYHSTTYGDSPAEYICNFTGKFSGLDKINEYTYKMQLESMECKERVGEEYYIDQRMCIGAEPYGLEVGKEFILYLPGCNTSDLPSDFLGWVSIVGDVSQELPFYGIYNIKGKYGFFSDIYEYDNKIDSGEVGQENSDTQTPQDEFIEVSGYLDSDPAQLLEIFQMQPNDPWQFGSEGVSYIYDDFAVEWMNSENIDYTLTSASLGKNTSADDPRFFNISLYGILRNMTGEECSAKLDEQGYKFLGYDETYHKETYAKNENGKRYVIILNFYENQLTSWYWNNWREGDDFLEE